MCKPDFLRVQVKYKFNISVLQDEQIYSFFKYYKNIQSINMSLKL